MHENYYELECKSTMVGKGTFTTILLVKFIERLVRSPFNFDRYCWHLKRGFFRQVYVHIHSFDAQMYRKPSRTTKTLRDFKQQIFTGKFIGFERSACTTILIVLL
jgi:hypothetical protein